MDKVLLTGASGFLGKVLHKSLGASTITLGRSPGNLVVSDLVKDVPVVPKVERVVHNAGKSHVIPKTSFEAEAFYDVNVCGTSNLLKGLEGQQLKLFIFISSVAVYGLEKGENIDESVPLHGKTPYAESKIKAEKLVKQWCDQRNIPLLIFRLPLVYGPDPPGNLGAICRLISSSRYIRIKKNLARKSIVLAEDIAELISTTTDKSGIYNLTDGENPLFSDIEDALAIYYEQTIRFSLPKSILSIGAKFGDTLRVFKLDFPLYSDRLAKMTSTLTFDDSKARRDLGWNPRSVLNYIQQAKVSEQ